ncbi:MAG: DUF2703 domain-containing protein [Nitrospirota bacterium]
MNDEKRKIIIEWYRYVKEGTTCCRCGESAGVVKKVVEDMRFALKPAGIDLELREIALGAEQLHLSNTIRIDGKDLMEILGEERPQMTSCPSCSALTGKASNCNTFIYDGKVYESVPEQMLVEAISKAALGSTAGTNAQEMKLNVCKCKNECCS